jgi:hypothetical protein
MKYTSSAKKAPRKTKTTPGSATSAGPQGIALSPPVYGVEVVDHGPLLQKEAVAPTEQPSSPTQQPPLPSGAIQAKLAINPTGDIYEQEADQVAETVMRMAAPSPEFEVQNQNSKSVIASNSLPSPTIQRADNKWNKAYGTRKSYLQWSYEDFKAGLGEIKPTTQGGLTENKGRPIKSSKGAGTPAAPEITLEVLKEIYTGLAANAAADPLKEEKAKGYCQSLNQAFKLMKIDTVEAQAVYLAHAFVESDQFRQFTETQGAVDKGKQKWVDDPSQLKLDTTDLNKRYNKTDTPEHLRDKRSVNPLGKFEFLGRGPVQVTHGYNYVEVIALLEKAAEQYQQAAANGDTEAGEYATLAQEAADAIKLDPKQAASPKYTMLVSATFMKKQGADILAAQVKTNRPWTGVDVASGWVAGGKQKAGSPQAEALIEKSAAYARIYPVLLREAKNASAQTQPSGQTPTPQPVQRKTTNGSFEADDSVTQRIATQQGSGSLLPAETRDFMESRFDADFGKVRVHTDSEAVQLSQAVQAQAFTHGSDIYFGQGKYNPSLNEGKQLLAHELTHVVQQTSGLRASHAPGATSIQREEENFKDLYVGYLLDDQILDEATKYNTNVREGKNPKVRPETIRQAQHLTGVGLAMPYKNGPDWDVILKQLSIGVATWQQRYLSNKDNSFKTDASLAVVVDGKLTPDTVKAMKLNGLTPSKKEWAEADQRERQAIRDEEKFYQQRVGFNPGSTGTVRQAIVDLAASQVGMVFADNRGDGSKYGWERIARYYEQAYAGIRDKSGTEQGPDAYFAGQRDEAGLPKANTQLADIKAANKYASDHKTSAIKKLQDDLIEKETRKRGSLTEAEVNKIRDENKHVENWSWCAIFAVWAVRAVTGRGVWTPNGPEGLGGKVEKDTLLQRARRGDLLHIKDSPQNHHVVMAQEVPIDATLGTPVTAVEGNLDAQEIAYTTRWKVADIDFYYQTVPEGSV